MAPWGFLVMEEAPPSPPQTDTSGCEESHVHQPLCLGSRGLPSLTPELHRWMVNLKWILGPGHLSLPLISNADLKPIQNQASICPAGS